MSRPLNGVMEPCQMCGRPTASRYGICNQTDACRREQNMLRKRESRGAVVVRRKQRRMVQPSDWTHFVRQCQSGNGSATYVHSNVSSKEDCISEAERLERAAAIRESWK